MPANADDLTATPIVWEHSGDGEFPFRATIGGRNVTIRVNDFPAEPLYTLLVDGVDRDDLEDWPSVWTKPPTPQPLLDRLAVTITAARLRAWSEQLCRLPAAVEPAESAAALGIAGSVVDHRDVATVAPPPSVAPRSSSWPSTMAEWSISTFRSPTAG